MKKDANEVLDDITEQKTVHVEDDVRDVSPGTNGLNGIRHFWRLVVFAVQSQRERERSDRCLVLGLGISES